MSKRHINVVETLKNELSAAFPVVNLPKRRAILRRDTVDPEGAHAVRRAFAGKAWTEIKADYLEGEKGWAAFCYLSPAAYNYYLPALIAHCLSDLRDANSLVGSTVFNLRPDYYYVYYYGVDNEFESRAQILNESQYAVICAFLGLVFDLIRELGTTNRPSIVSNFKVSIGVRYIRPCLPGTTLH